MKRLLSVIVIITCGCSSSKPISEKQFKPLNEKPIILPAPSMKGGMPLMEALKKRKTIRTYSDKKITSTVLSNLLWSAYGINRQDEKKRTAPSCMNWQEIEIYCAMEDGVFLYDPLNNSLTKILNEDIREKTTKFIQPSRDSVAKAPLTLIFVADLSKTTRIVVSEKEKHFYISVDTGFISQNVYLFCASEGLGTVVRGLFNREELTRILGFDDSRYITLVQTVGYPRKDE